MLGAQAWTKPLTPDRKTVDPNAPDNCDSAVGEEYWLDYGQAARICCGKLIAPGKLIFFAEYSSTNSVSLKPQSCFSQSLFPTVAASEGSLRDPAEHTEAIAFKVAVLHPCTTRTSVDGSTVIPWLANLF
jgi:hypothetical protein